MEERAREPRRGALEALLRWSEGNDGVVPFAAEFLEEDSSRRRRNWELFIVEAGGLTVI